MGLVTEFGASVIWLAAVATAVVALYKMVVKRFVVDPVKAVVERWERIEKGVESAQKGVEAAQKVIGQNGGSTLFAAIAELRDQVVDVQTSIRVTDQAIFTVDPFGEIAESNMAFRRLTGYEVTNLRHGGWRSRLEPDDMRAWDDMVAHKASIDRRIGLSHYNGDVEWFQLSTVPMFGRAADGTERFLGWKCAIVAREEEAE